MNSPRHHRLSLLSLLCIAALLGACASNPPAPDADRHALNHPHGGTSALAAVAQDPPPPAPSAPELTATPTVAAAEAMLEDTLRPGVKVDLTEVPALPDLWARVKTGFAMPTLDNDGVRRAEAWYSARPDYVERMTTRGSRYLFHIIEEVEKRSMPTELALLPFVESAFVTDATSRAKAAGMWQFMPATGRDFDLKQNIFRDDRRDVLASTRAALDYLGRLHKMFGDWQLALAAYNWGQGNVAKAIARNERAGLPTDYDSIRMPDETRYYLPKLQAVKNIVLAPGNYGLSLPAIANHPYFLSVNIDRDMDVEVAARLAGMSVEEFKQFNPQMNKPVILAASSGQLLLPYDNASAFATRLAAHRGPLASWTAWVVPRTMKPADAARQVGMSEAALRELNHIPPKMLVRQGSTLLVPRGAQRDADVSEHLADNASISLAPDRPPAPKLKRVGLKAAKGDTVASIAARYKVLPRQVAQWNRIAAQALLKPGQSLVVYQAVAETQVAKSGGKPATRKSRASNRGGAPKTALVRARQTVASQ